MQGLRQLLLLSVETIVSRMRLGGLLMEELRLALLRGSYLLRIIWCLVQLCDL
jgi:hypothetical protein